MSEPPSKRTYTQEEVTEILKRAMKQQSLQKQGLTHEELVEMANEVGIDRGAVESATAELVETRADELARQAEASELAQERSRLFNGFVSSLFFYLVICGALFFIDTRFTGGHWYYWPALGWGIALLFRLHAVLFPQRSLTRRKARELKRARREERRALRRARHRELRESFGLDVRTDGNRLGADGHGNEVNVRQRSHDVEAAVNAGAREFETAVQAGVAALLNVAARKIHEHAARAVEGERSEAFKRRR
ncbi:MAG TPA: 2TM domain-containing protein [Polyangiaceae bacterium]|jgi:hypothetical protein|nr:2TM domain-containing protein [Polyangiaceae bacterium]